MNEAKRPRIAVRFGVTLFTNTVSAATGFAVSLLLARGLGPSDYGNLSFLLATGAAINSWLDSGSSAAFYTFLSRGASRRLHVALYSAWLLLRFLLIATAVVALPFPAFNRFWVGNPRDLVLWSLGAYFLSIPVQTMVVHIFESARNTIEIQLALAAVSIAHLLVLGGLHLAGCMTVRVVFMALIAEYAALAAFSLWRNRGSLRGRPSRAAVGDALTEYRAYCVPLFFYSAASFIGQFCDRWLLQRYGGALQQGLFSVSQQFSTVALMATAALINILWKEIADADSAGDSARASSLFLRSSRLLFAISAATGAFVVPHCRDLTVRMLGQSYAAAWPALSLLMLYPAFQTVAQLNAVYFYSTKNVRIHVFLSSTATLAAVPITYLVLASPDARIPGFGWGATGLAARWTLFQVAFVIWQSRAIARLQATGDENLRRIGVMSALLAVAWASSALAGLLMNGADIFLRMALSGMVFASVVVPLALRYPEHSGVETAFILSFWTKLRSRASAA